MKAIYLPNPYSLSDKEVITFDYRKGLTLGGVIADTGMNVTMQACPIVPMLNGHEIAQADWNVEIAESDVIAFVQLPEGPAIPAIVAWVAANWVAIAAFVGAMVVSALMTPGMPEFGNPNADAPTGSPTYNISSRGNRARLGEPKPVVYGALRTYPDLAARSYSEFVGNDQFLYQLFECSQGDCVIDESSMRFEDTALTDFGDYEVEVIAPGATPKLYPYQVNTASTVTGQDVDGETIGPYIAVATTTKATRLSIDITAPGGLYYQTDDGSVQNHSVKLKIEAQEIDDAGANVGALFTLGEETISGASATAIRQTHNYNVTAGRYKVQVSRVGAKPGSLRYSSTVRWQTLRAYLEDATDITTTTRVALRIRASNSVANGVVNKFNLVVQRKIATWSTAGGWAAPALNNNPVWAFADIVRSSYGGDRSDAYLDLPALEALAAVLAAEGGACNAVFDQKDTMWGALTKVAQTARAVPIDQAGVLRMVRDSAPPAVPVAVFGMRNIVKDSFHITHMGVLEETSDGVIGEYLDEAEDYRPMTVACYLPESLEANPRRVSMFGVTNRDQAFNLGMYLTASNRLRRQIIDFQTGIEGHIPGYGDLIRVSHRLLGNEGEQQVSGDVQAFDGATLLTLSEPVDHLSDPYIIIRNKYGEPSATYQAAKVVGQPRQITVAGVDASLFDFSPGYERIQFVCGDTSTFTADIKVTDIETVSDQTIKITGFVDDAGVYSAANGLTVPTRPTPPGTISIAPVVSDLAGLATGTAAAPVVVLSWTAKNSDAYELEFSTDAGVTWFPLGQTKATTFEHRPAPGTIHYRVAGLNLFRGAYKTVIVDTNIAVIQPPPAITGLVIRGGTFDGPELTVDWASNTTNHLIEFVSGGTVYIAMRTQEKTFTLAGTVAREVGLGRAFDVRVTSINAVGILSDTPVTLSVSNAAPAVPNNISIIGVVDGIWATMNNPTESDLGWLRVWGSTTSGFTVDDTTLLADSPRSTVTLATEDTLYLRFAFVDVWDDTVANLNVSGEFVAAPGLVGAAKISVNELSAINANLGTVTSGTFKTDAVSGERVELSSVGNYPLWIGNGTKNDANGTLYYNKATDKLVFKGQLDVKSATSGARTEIKETVIKVYDATGTLRVKIGDLNA